MPALTKEIVAELLAKGMNQTAIAKEYDVTRQYVHILAKRAGYQPFNSRLVRDNLPWEDISSEHDDNVVFQAMRLHARVRVGGREQIRGKSRDKVNAMFRKLIRFNQVIDYDPSYPPMPGLSGTGGFAYVPRQESDEDYMIRIKPGVRLTEEGKKIWKMPKELLE
ncbi:hypothetical protein [Corynebacterium pelargi]|uniref:Uncharacterized protein n=1 Tax=Corynebacterium pelargi TaxID=1471400 RepID=A0A410W903_9CORY|nr:hypothetical protein [Corynebacterium pelargi]QAU52431.1 hypothetical protein CPELA_05805 [Corynebacterium pelargi]GGG67724.1 hypothetical protein GCM10007338_00350 [Corynebacterium pelargi]